MSNLGNKEILSKNLKYYIEKSGKDRRELAEIWGFPYSTVSEWINGNKYPRIDRIEIMADYFGILKSDLIEERTEEYREMKKHNDIQTDIVVRMRTDEEFYDVVKRIYELDREKLSSLRQLLQ
jgi:repressor LexA